MVGRAPGAPATKEDKDKAAAASAAAARRASKKGKGMIKYYVAIAVGVVSVLVAIYLAATSSSGSRGGGRRGGGGNSAASKDTKLVNDKSFIYGVTGNAAGNFTAAASPFFDRWTYADVKYGLDGVGLYGEKMIGMSGALKTCEKEEGIEGGTLPPAYDVRESWPTCISEPYNSGNCSSSYAIAAAQALSARFCIADESTYKNVKLSPQQILSCDKKSRGCKGGGADAVFDYLESRGLYPEECVPFAGGQKTQCKTTCQESQKLKAISHCVLGGEKAIKREIINYGPVVAPLYLKDDFLVYESGVYTPLENARPQISPKGEAIVQAVTLLGWGRSEGTKYWIVGNSWGNKWGENGYARVAIDTAVREGYALTTYPATAEALAADEKQKEEAAKRLEEAKKDRAAREERIREARKKREEEEQAAKDAADSADLDDDDWEDEVENLDVDDTPE
mmetsp:Transcript_74549/g.198024  ORF Transcript_74549/g.198024 Transcript_74549/m.198024 type:complete len:451 (-) Transcript_74549:20-1372(-)|eukprot:CAMPEP_0171197178 /NCGR_PEP_ID=MMETSP0790-20130122/22279_1 /TAXON_ID=2925 /ORGANISM="Alexandrium catenella, Strain OF101" /LENGTH=450 /DNA_ID=CAMNT_0011662415 /DNA_START=96 /DNA_END=1448 /DNA_ORIENTATION=+